MILLDCSCKSLLHGVITRVSNQENVPFPAPTSLFFSPFPLRESNKQSYLRALSFSFLCKSDKISFVPSPASGFHSRVSIPAKLMAQQQFATLGLILPLFIRKYTREKQELILMLLDCTCKLIVERTSVPAAKAIVRALHQANLPFLSQASFFSLILC